MTIMLPDSNSYGAWSVVATVVLGILLLVKFLTSSKHKNLPPGPRGLPIIGALHMMGKYQPRALAKLAETHGPLMSLWFGPKLVVVASSSAGAEEILKNQGSNFSNRQTTSVQEILMPHAIGMAADSPTRLHLKKILHTNLSTTRQMQLTENVRMEEVAHVLRVIPQDGATVAPVRTYIEVAVTNIVSRMILRKRFMVVATGEEHDEQELEQVVKFREISMDIQDCIQTIFLGDFISIFKWVDIQGFRRRLRNLKARMDAFSSKIISEHVEQRKSGLLSEKGMIDVLLDQMEDEKLRVDITNVQVNSLLWDGFAASTNAVVDTIEWAISECICNPNVMKKAQAEIDAVVGKSRRVEDADVSNLKYLQAIIKENFRVHPIAPLMLPHMSGNACKVLGYDIPAETLILVNVGAIVQDPSIWEDPLVFKPERFLEGMPYADISFEGKHFELIPFGSGRRACPGLTLATTMVHLVVASFLQSFDWSLPHGLQCTDLDMSEAEGVGHRRAHPLAAIPKARLSIS